VDIFPKQKEVQMDKIKRLQERKAALTESSGVVREELANLFDENSFVELAAFSFSKEQFYQKGGEGVITGFATIQGYPYYVVAQNFADSFGGLTKANCEKIAKTLDAAEKNETPVIYLLHCQGVKVGEGVDVLEGISTLLLKATQLKGTVPQYAVVCGEVYGSAAVLASVCDVVFFTKSSAMAASSPLVLSAKANKNLKKEEVGGYSALNHAGLPAVLVDDLNEVAEKIAQITEIVGLPIDDDAALNEAVPALNESVTVENILSVLENPVELGANSSPEVKTVLGRVGGLAVAAVVFDQVSLNERNVKKIRDFAEFACCYGLPFVTFVDCNGIEQSLSVNNSSVLKQIAEYLSILDAIDTAKIAVVTKKAIGLGYSLFAAKSAGFDYTYAFATAEISLFESVPGAQIVGSGDDCNAQRYAEEYADPVNAAKGGYLDNVIEPQFVKQYLTASLQMLLR